MPLLLGTPAFHEAIFSGGTELINMNAIQEETVSELRGLISACRDTQEGFRTASELVTNDPELKMLLSSFSLQASKFAGELENQLIGLGENVPERERGSFTGALHRGWMNLKATVGGADNHSVLSECEREQDTILENYNKALLTEMPDNIRQVVQRQRDELVTTHNTVRALRDSHASSRTPMPGEGRIGEAGPTIGQNLQAKTAQAKAGATEVWDEMKSRAGETRELGEGYIHRNPLTSLGTALLLGFGIGMAFYAFELRNERIRMEVSRRPLRRIGTALAGWLGFLAGRARSGYRGSVEQVQDIASEAPGRIFPRMRRNRFMRPLRTAWEKMT